MLSDNNVDERRTSCEIGFYNMRTAFQQQYASPNDTFLSVFLWHSYNREHFNFKAMEDNNKFMLVGELVIIVYNILLN